VVIAAPRGAGSTRRVLLQPGGAGLAAAVAALVSACGGRSHKPRVEAIPSGARAADVEILNQALDREHQAIAAYTAVIPLLSGGAQAAAMHFLDQELSHAGELAGLIKQAGGRASKPRASYDLGRPRTRAEILGLLHALEREQLAGYVQAVSVVAPGQVRAAIAAILGNDAQHASVLRLALGLDPAPSPFVTGAE
jgi:rubrerythrin